MEVVGGPNRTDRVTGPLGEPVEARWYLRGSEAFIEMASASGLDIAGGAAGNDPLNATSRGTGELIAAAVSAGASRIVVGLGGSACTDGGLGCFDVLRSDRRLAGIRLVGACDVLVPFEGAVGFAAQKGATAEHLVPLAARLREVAEIYETQCGLDVRGIPGAGAAGGLGGALAVLGAELVAGIEIVAEELELQDRITAANLVVTGEGLLDPHSFEGKAVGWILQRAAAAGIPTLVIVGQRDLDRLPESLVDGAVEVISLVERYGSGRALSNTLGCIEAVVEEFLTHEAGLRSLSPRR